MLDVASKRPLGIITKMTKPNKKAEVLLGKDSKHKKPTLHYCLLGFSSDQNSFFSCCDLGLKPLEEP